MTQYGSKLRERARAVARAFDRAQRYAKGVGLFFATQAQVPRTAFMIFASWGLEEISKQANAMADDPADPDYDHLTVRRPLGIRVEQVAHFASGDPVAQQALTTAVRADDAASALSAHLRAFERFQGARERGDETTASQRALEAGEHARYARASLRHLAVDLKGLSDRLAEVQPPSEIVPGRVVAADDLAPDILAILYIGGLRIQTLEAMLKSYRSITPRLEILDEAADGANDLAEELNSWEPPPFASDGI